jgi:hypothetical protein
MTQTDTTLPHPLSTRADNGILGRVPSEFIARASRSLPDPCVDIDAAWAGRVRLTFRKQRYSRPRAKTSYVAWLCRHAEPIDQVSVPIGP